MLLPLFELRTSARWMLVVLWGIVCLGPVQADERLEHFESKVRPVFERACIECHRGDEPKGGLRLTDRAGWSEAGVIEPGRPSASLLMEVLRSKDAEVRMPPVSSGKSLSEAEIRAIEHWIAQGAIDPREDAREPETLGDRAMEGDSDRLSNSVGPKKRNRIFEITPEDESYWAFQPVARPPFSESESMLSASQKIDVLIRRRLSSLPGVDLAPLATPRELARRASFDLWGLPPDPEIIEALANDPTLDTWTQWIDGLLQSHRYGERWGRYWLDWVRFAETNGYERDGPKPHAWRYRDYVIRSFAEDKPYNEFVLEQLAGDEWAAVQGWTYDTAPDRWRECIIATGFHRLHQWDDEPDDSEVAQFDEADDVMVSIGAVFLGLTIGCARCHDHKFDPIRQKDYYALLAFMRGVDPYGMTKKGGGGRGTGRIQRFLVPDSESAAWELERQGQIEALLKRKESESDPAIRLQLDGEIQQVRDRVPPFDAALAVAEHGTEITPTFVLHRGDVHSPRDAVSPEVLGILQKRIAAPEWSGPFEKSSGRRLQLARWIASSEHPLTARVLVNRIWQRHFGVGIVPTPDDFGRTGRPPSNLPLLDYLASELVESGWSVRHIHRIILLSHAYRMSSRSEQPSAWRDDPEGELFWRQGLRRLDAEAIRDSMLWMAGNMGDKSSGPSVFPTLTPEVRESANPVSVSQWIDSPAEAQNCRSVYLVVKRSLKVPFLESLDFANSSSPVGVRTTTTTAPQALLLLNEPWVHQQAALLAQRIERETDASTDAKLSRLWWIVYQRRPESAELEIAKELLRKQTDSVSDRLGAERSDGFSSEAWQSLCRAVLNSNEAIYID